MQTLRENFLGTPLTNKTVLTTFTPLTNSLLFFKSIFRVCNFWDWSWLETLESIHSPNEKNIEKLKPDLWSV
ncbi:MAG: hypothetical protein QF788_02420, partial [SAR324 cluster bacterium]|nr:hypothetical protein [SAR324 cluster bacterium]